MNKISICVATRKRPDIFKRMCESVLSLADNPDNIEFLICRDKDDDSIYEYLGNYKVLVDDRTAVDFRLNEAWKRASGDIYGFNADDILFETKGWDTMVIDKFNEYPDKIVYVYPNGHYARSLFGIIGFVHKNWTDTVGYFVKPDFARRADCWLNDLAGIIGRKGYINSFGIKNIKILDDEVHREYIDYAEKVGDLKNYHSKKMRNQRIKDVKKLNDFINSYRSGRRYMKKNISTLNYIVKKYNIDLKDGSYIEIPNTDRIELAYLFEELGFKRGVEVGVGEGIYSEALLKANPKLKLYGVDPYIPYEAAGNFGKKEQLDSNYKTAVKKFAPYKNYTFVKKTSMKAMKDFEDKSLDFVYIDANHEYSYVFEDITGWYKKIKKGGIISGYAYRRSESSNTKLQVVNAVNDYIRKYNIKHLFILGRKQGIEGEKRDKYRSWFWVK